MKKLVIAMIVLLISGSFLPVFAQHHENPPASLGDRIAVMDFVFPENIGTNEDFTLKMILYDETNKKNFEQVSIQLAIYKEGIKKSLMNELFYDKNGEIIIDFKHKDFDQPNKREIKASTEPILGGWMKDYGSNIQVLQNMFSENALYTLEATIVTIDHTRTFISEPITFTNEIHIGGHGEIHTIELDIPDWIRNNAKWWSNGDIDDKTFAGGIQYMIKEGIIKIPPTESEQTNNEVKIPDWIRNNAKWWSNGDIDDKTFANGIQFMIKEGIISISIYDSQNSSDELDMSECDQFTTAAEKRICLKEIELANKIKSDIEKSTSYVIGPVTFYYVDDKIEKTSQGGTILTIYFVVENTGSSHDITLSCPVNACNYALSDGQKEIQHTTNTLVYGSLTLQPHLPKLLEWSFYKGLDYDPEKDYSFKIKESWGSGSIPLEID